MLCEKTLEEATETGAEEKASTEDKSLHVVVDLQDSIVKYLGEQRKSETLEP